MVQGVLCVVAAEGRIFKNIYKVFLDLFHIIDIYIEQMLLQHKKNCFGGHRILAGGLAKSAVDSRSAGIAFR